MSLATHLQSLQENRVESIRRQAAAFEAVFGQEHSRSSDQKIVIAALAELCGQSTARTILDKEGRIDPHSAVFNEATRGIYLFIEGQLKTAASESDQPKTRTKR